LSYGQCSIYDVEASAALPGERENEMKKSDKSINRQKTIDFIISRNYGKEVISQKIRDDVQRHLGINYTVWNVTGIRQDIRKGVAKPSTITETLLALTTIELVTSCARQVGGIDELITIATLIKQHKILD